VTHKSLLMQFLRKF